MANVAFTRIHCNFLVVVFSSCSYGAVYMLSRYLNMVCCAHIATWATEKSSVCGMVKMITQQCFLGSEKTKAYKICEM